MSTAVSELEYSRGFEAQDFEAPRAHRAARGFGVAIVAREHRVEAFFVEQHVQRLAQAVEQVRRRRVGKEAVLVRPSISSHDQ